MFNKTAENTTSRLILVGAPLATMFLVTDSVTDPVNAPKLLICGGLGFSLIFIFLSFNLRENFKNFKPYIFANLLFLAAALNAILQSEAPKVQQIYGVFGRNTGFVAYLALCFIAIGVLPLREQVRFKQIIYGLQFAGIVNVAYCAWVLAFGDFLKWGNPYGNILGLFGNPNFISAFLGMFITSLVAYSFSPEISYTYRIVSLFVGVLAFYEIIRSHAIQGIIVTVAGLGIVVFYVIRSRFKQTIIPTLYLFTISIAAGFAALGALQRGPLDFIYKRSVSLRGIYWESALAMGEKFPFTGVGLDSYGDWYRRARPTRALVDPGLNTTTNAAHNVVLDFFANGGWPLLLSYGITLVFGATAILKTTRRLKEYDGIFVTLSTVWMCYQLQSIISINQMGLAIWGWLLTGALIAYEFSTREHNSVGKSIKGESQNKSKLNTTSIFSPQFVGGLGLVVGLLIACPPMSGDSKWRSALDSKDANRVMESLKPGYFSPSDSQRYAQASLLFANSNLFEQARSITLRAVRYNPDDYLSWRNLYFLPNSTEEEKLKARENLYRLDPLNPDVTRP